MQKIFASISIVAVLTIGGIVYAQSADCGGWFQPSCDSSSGVKQIEQQAVTANLSKLLAQVPIPQLDNSLERANISKRLTTWSDPAKISYIYLISFGRVMAYYVMKGKVTSGSKRLTATQQIVNAPDEFRNGGDVITDAPELDGTYGTSNPYIFFWTTDGTYVQWSGDYMLTDQPLQLSTQPELIRTVK